MAELLKKPIGSPNNKSKNNIFAESLIQKPRSKKIAIKISKKIAFFENAKKPIAKETPEKKKYIHLFPG